MNESPVQDTHPNAVSGKKVISLFIVLFAMVALPLTWWLHGGGEGVHDSPPLESQKDAGSEQEEPSHSEPDDGSSGDVVEDTSSP
jgi:hypothetical protein